MKKIEIKAVGSRTDLHALNQYDILCLDENGDEYWLELMPNERHTTWEADLPKNHRVVKPITARHTDVEAATCEVRAGETDEEKDES